MLLLIALLHPSIASPDRVTATFDLGTQLTVLAPSPDGRWIGTVEKSSDQLRVLDTLTWDASALDSAPCDGVVGVAGWEGDDGAQRFYVGCADGSLAWAEVSNDGVQLADNDERVEVTSGDIKGVVAGTDGLYVLESTDDVMFLHLVDPDTGLVDGSGAFPVELTMSGFEELLWTGTAVLVLHGSDNVSEVNGTTGSLAIPDTSFASADCVDGSVADGPVPLFACGAVGVLWYSVTAYEWVLMLDDDNGLSAPVALAVDQSDSDDPFLVVADDGFALVYPYNSATGYPYPDADERIDLEDHALHDMVSVDGYTIGADDAGSLVVLTGRPWVEIAPVADALVVDGDQVSLTFTSDTAGDWELVLGDDQTVLDSGTITAGATGASSFTVGAGDAIFEEGGNLLRVIVSASGVTGSDGVLLTVDNPPDRVSLSADDVGYGDQTIELSFDGITDADLAEYHVYVSTTSFVADDFSDGGPAYDGSDDLSGIEGYDSTLGYFVLDGLEPGDAGSLTLYPITNGVTHYLAVRAVDEGGQEGAMSKVVSATPQETYTLAERTNDDGGFCGTPGPAGALGALLAGGLSLLRRRARGGAAAVLVAGLALSAGGTAWAGDKPPEVKPSSTVQLRFGPMWFADDNPILDQFSEPNNVWWLEGGPSWRGLAEINAGVGWYNKAGYLMGEDGTLATAQDDRMQVIPVTLSGTLRLDVLREQPIVPTATIGGDYWIWRELYDSGDSKAHVGGGKTGWHYGFGLQILLDTFDQRQASLFEARSGVRDSYIVAEYRVQTIEPDSGISFSADSVTVGIKVNR